MKAKLGVLVIVAVIAFAGIGVSYACVDPNAPRCYCDVAFVDSVYAYDNEDEKDIGTIDAWLNGEYNNGLYNGIWVDIFDAYPGYVVFIDFTVKNTGDRPIDVNGLVPIDYDPSAMSFSLTGDISQTTWLDTGASVDGTLVITVENDALESHTYYFKVGFGFSSEECDP